MNPEQMFTDEELELLADSRFFELKASINQKLTNLLGLLAELLKAEIAMKEIALHDEVLQSNPKISRGENYKGFPWLVLDYPRVFKQNDVFAFRSLCWWGHEFSFTLHLSGLYFDAVKKRLPAFLAAFREEQIFIGISDTPWNYYFEKDNYLLIEELLKQENDIPDWISHRSFIKISKKTNLQNFSAVPGEANTFYRMLMGQLFNKENL